MDTGKRVQIGIWQLAWPAIVGNLLQSLVGFVDVKVVGILGADAVAAAGVGQRLFFTLQAVLMAVTAGTTALVARAWGAEDREEGQRVVSASLVLCCGIALLLGVAGFALARPVAAAFGLEPGPRELAAVFIRWLSVFNVVFAMAVVLWVALRAVGDTRTPLWIGAITNVVNIALLYVLVPRLGIAGAALANGLAFSVGALVTGALWIKGKLLIRPEFTRLFEASRIKRIFSIGTPAFFEQLVWQGGFVIFIGIIATSFGTAPLAAYNIGVAILSFSFVVGFGFSIAASTLVGQYLGAGDPDGASEQGWRAMWLAVGSMIVLGITIIVCARWIAQFMIDDPEVVRLTVIFIYILGAVQPLMAIEFSLAGALRGAGDTRFPLVATLSGLIGARVALALALTWLGMPVEWIYASLIADYIVKATLLVTRFRSGKWQHVLQEPEGADPAPVPAS